MNVWKLTITDKQSAYAICGSEEVLRDAMDQWTETTIDTGGIIVIEGFTDSADRAKHKLAVKRDEIVCMSIYKMY
jgi:hypothetical protein